MVLNKDFLKKNYNSIYKKYQEELCNITISSILEHKYEAIYIGEVLNATIAFPPNISISYISTGDNYIDINFNLLTVDVKNYPFNINIAIIDHNKVCTVQSPLCDSFNCEKDVSIQTIVYLILFKRNIIKDIIDNDNIINNYFD